MREEFVYFTNIFFSKVPKKIDEDLLNRYEAANKIVFQDNKNFNQSQNKIDGLVRVKADIEAIEYAWRRLDPENILTKKLQILYYLLEVRSDFLPSFTNTNNSTIQAIFYLVLSLYVAVTKLIKGKLLLRSYELI